MFVRMRLTDLFFRQSPLRISRRLLLGDDWAVFRMEDQRAVLQRVGLGNRSTLQSQILQGLNEGDAIVAHPGEGIKEGDRIRPAP